MEKEKRLTWKRSLDGCEDVGLCEGVTVGEAICKLADLEERDIVEVVHGQNISPMHPVDEFQCSKCGIILRDWVEVTIDEDELDEQYNEYEFKHCPNCGAKLDGGNDNG